MLLVVSLANSALMLMYKHLLVHGIIGYHKLKETHKDHQVKSLVLPELTKIKNVVQLQLET